VSPAIRVKRVGGRFGAILLLVLMADPLRGQLPPPSPGGPRIHMAVDTARVTVGDRIRLRVAVDHPPDSRVIWPDSLNLGPFQVLDAQVGPTQEGGGVARSTLTLTLAAFELGDLEIPGFQVEVMDPQGGSEALETDPYGIRVESVGLDEGGDIREIKGPLRLPRGLGGMLLLAFVVGLAALLAWILHRRWKRKRGGLAEAPSGPPPRPPHEVALEALARLEASPLLERGEVKDYHIQVSEILRVYVEGRFRVPALEMTTWDVTRGLQRVGLEDPLLGDFRRFLDRCDLVKFAKHRPESEESRAVLADGRRFVEETIPGSVQPTNEVPEQVGAVWSGEGSREETP
jgi:hypothetical protein